MGIAIFILVFWFLTIFVLRAKYSDPEELKKWERKQMHRNRRMPWE